MIEIIPTVVPVSWDDVEATARRYPFAHALHVDFADGLFAPNTTWLPDAVRPLAIKDVTLEAHLMVQAPQELGGILAASGFSRIIGHVEAMQSEDVKSTLDAWRVAGAHEVGLGLLFQSPLELLEPHLSLCDVVQMMSIGSIGVQGIPYEPSSTERIALLHRLHPEVLLADDGGVGEGNIVALASAGVRRFCVGSALSKAANPTSAYDSLLTLAGSGV